MIENLKIGFVGAGNMGSAIIGGLIASKKSTAGKYLCVRFIGG